MTYLEMKIQNKLPIADTDFKKELAKKILSMTADGPVLIGDGHNNVLAFESEDGWMVLNYEGVFAGLNSYDSAVEYMVEMLDELDEDSISYANRDVQIIVS